MVAAALIGVCLGFLPHNFSPARVFMGDSGSMLIGLLLATTTITLTGSVNPNDVGTDIAPALVPLLLPLAVMLVPFLDLLLAIVRRTAAGRSPFAPDKQHLHHRLLERGHSHARAVLVMYLWSGVLAFGAVAVAFLDPVPLITQPRRRRDRRAAPHHEPPPAAARGRQLHRPAPRAGPVRVEVAMGPR